MLSARKRRSRLFRFAAAFHVLLAVLLAFLASPRPATAQTTQSVTFVWTAPGDDGATGRATRYDLRYSPNAISGTDTLGWWNAAVIVNMSAKVPSSPGTLESMTVGGLVQGVRYYAILRTADEVPNWSPFSNVATFLVSDSTPPRQVFDLIAR